MNADAILHHVRDTVIRRRRGNVLLHAVPWLGMLAVLAWRCNWNAWVLLLLALATATTIWLAWRAAQAIDARWLARRLDALRPDMEDSAALLFIDSGIQEESSSPRRRGPSDFDSENPKSLGPRLRGDDGQTLHGPLQRLQRQRLRSRLESGTPPDLRDPWSLRALSWSWLVALGVLFAVVSWPLIRTTTDNGIAPPSTSEPGAAASPRLVGQRLDIRPPAYTGLPARQQSALEAKVSEGTTLQWTLRFAPMPESAALVFDDGRHLPLQRNGDDWVARKRIDRSALYRIVLPTPLPASQASLHRIDAIADTPPVLRALQPGSNLSIRRNGQRTWALLFEADDDHGLASRARLQLIQTQGGGENISTKQRTLTISGRGDARHKRYAHTLDLASLGLVAGDDLIVRLDVADNRSPRPQHTLGPSFILRWPPEQASESTGMEGLVKRAMPAYFRSQRQIIIDAEALLKQKRKLDAPVFLKRSDELGVDQRILRMRYGQFLGEESEGAPPLPTNDLPTNDAVDDHDAAPPVAQAEEHSGHDDHATAAGTPPTKFGQAGAVVAEYGHVHDLPEAATLLDPGTRKLLRAALDQMWQSEQQLRLGKPDAALPFAYKALGFIKQVQQADRIYLARTGSELPPIDEGRRLGGDRTGLADRRDGLTEAAPLDPIPADSWRALQDTPRAGYATPEYDALTRWARANNARAADPLALIAAIDAARRDPSCTACRQRLRQALWPMLPRPTATVGGRSAADKTGQAYLDALGDEGAR